MCTVRVRRGVLKRKKGYAEVSEMQVVTIPHHLPVPVVGLKAGVGTVAWELSGVLKGNSIGY